VSRPEIAVVVPLEDPRGDVVDHLRTWTRGQTLARNRFQVVLGADGRHPDFERRVAGELTAQDELVTVPGAPLLGLYDVAARAATAPVLVLTEAHVRADPGCLQAVAELFAADPGLDAATFEHRQSTSNAVSRLSERWFGRVHALWERQGWPRLPLAGVAIRAESYVDVGGLDPDLGLFAPFFLSARFDAKGKRVKHLEAAKITHVLEDTVDEGLMPSRNHASGECAARLKHDPEFMQRYFGPLGLWERRLAYRPEVAAAIVAALLSATRRSPRDAAWLLREAAVRFPAWVAGARPRSTWERGIAGLHRAVAGSGLIPFELRWRSYITAMERSVEAVRLQEGAQVDGDSGPRPLEGQVHADSLDQVVAGVHGLERQDDQRFRWTEPVALLRVRPAEGATLRIDTGGLRGAPLRYLYGIYAGADPLPRDLISGDEREIEARLPADFARTAAETGIVLICRPFAPARDGSDDRRRLGMPIVELELSPLAEAAEESRATSTAPA
jgi:hypothetical protein